MRFFNIILDWLLVRSLTVTHLNESLSHFFKRGKMGLDEQGVQKIIKGKIHGSMDDHWSRMVPGTNADGRNPCVLGQINSKHRHTGIILVFS